MLSLKTSIILLTYNKIKYTQACIESIRQYTPKGTYQLIVVDNLSTDGTRDWLADQTDILTIFNEENVGFPKGCNQGIDIATGDNILLLNNDVLVTRNWLSLMNDCLYSSDDIGAVGPVSNSAYGDQEINASYSTLDEMWDFANKYNIINTPDWEQKIKLIGFCMLIRKEVVEQVGLLDEIFSPGMCEDGDYSLRIIQAGYKLMVCRNIFIHHFGSTSFGEMPELRQQLWARNREKFVGKWGLPTAYRSKEELVQLIDEADRQKSIRVLDVNCGSGSALLRVKYLYPAADVYGIEENVKAADITSTFANVKVGKIEEIKLEENFYDYIILSDVFEQLINPWSYVSDLKNALKTDGKMLVSISNASHYGFLFSLLKNKSLYGDNNVLNNNQLRLYTLTEIQSLFVQAGFSQIEYSQEQNQISETEHQFIDQIARLSGLNNSEHLRTTRYNLKVMKQAPLSSVDRIKDLLEQLSGSNEEGLSSVTKIIDMMKEQLINPAMIIEAMKSLNINKQNVYNFLANKFFEAGLYNDIVPLLNASLELNPKHHDTLYNYAFILHSVGAGEAALQYLKLMDTEDEESSRLLHNVLHSLERI
ncbi:glycosyltransferase [Paenibacillus sp. LMG 31459]|uniref:Glycosyltransferase n=1 Tax=Paenibacillus phytohabitans TaxID=2654978 RepID=A0ABX1YE39_9BACL|nr:glycosyltransferase [Paenibacillus phytohabitans]NOU79232.1 glycosyltransferase [Paenibacillus phytohabitans]